MDPKFLKSKELTPELDFSFVESKEIDCENFYPWDNSRWFTTRDDLWTSFVLCSSWEKISNSWGRNPESWLEIEALLLNLGRSPDSGSPSVSVSEPIIFGMGFKGFAVVFRVFLLNFGLSGTHPFLIFQHFAQ